MYGEEVNLRELKRILAHLQATKGQRWNVGFDLDHASQFTLLKTYLNVQKLGKTYVLSSRERHYHLKTFVEGDYSVEETQTIRLQFNDDNRRVAREQKANRGGKEWQDKLFNGKMKVGDRKMRWEEPLENVLALPFYSKVKHAKKPVLGRKKRNKRM